jgi:hypothetical protein
MLHALGLLLQWLKTLASNLAVPIAATAFCSLAMLFMPERVVNAVSNLLGWFGLVF